MISSPNRQDSCCDQASVTPATQTEHDANGVRTLDRQVVRGLHNTNRHHMVDGPAITVSPSRATVADSLPSCRNAVLDAIDRLQQHTGATEFARRDIVAEVQSAGPGFERQTIYRCIRRLTGEEPGGAYNDLEDLGGDRLRVR